jgi:RNA polymerase sigma-70 factor (ECF subfamily)
VVDVAGATDTHLEPSDDELIEAVVRGDDRVAGLLHDRVVGAIDRTLYRIFGRREVDHDDLVQSTFEQIVITLCRRRFARACSLTTWATTVATHVGLNALRARRRERRVVDHAHGLDEGLPTRGEGALDARFALARVRAHLAAMDPVKAETLFLHDALGHDLAEVAVLTGVSVAAAQSRLVRARKELMTRIDRDGDGR